MLFEFFGINVLLGHIHHQRISKLCKSMTGMPNLNLASKVDKCPTCMAAKMHQSSGSANDSCTAAQCNQGLSIDFAFVIQKSKDAAQHKHCLGLGGETCCCLVTNHFGGTLCRAAFCNKTLLIEWLNKWLAQHAPACPDKCVHLDQGGELTNCAEV